MSKDWKHSRQHSRSKGKKDETSQGYSSNADLFNRRGDPWISDREGRSSFGRNLESENPDYDRYFAGKAEEREDKKKRESRLLDALKEARIKENKAKAEELGVSDRKKAVNNVLKMRAAMKKNRINKS